MSGKWQRKWTVRVVLFGCSLTFGELTSPIRRDGVKVDCNESVAVWAFVLVRQTERVTQLVDHRAPVGIAVAPA